MGKIFKFLVVFSIFFSGCAALAPTALISPLVQAVILWKDGEAHKYYPHAEKVVYSATKRSLLSLGVSIQKESFSKGVYHINASQNNKFSIKIDAAEPHVTKVSIRIDFMGDKDYAELIYKTIDNQLNVIVYENGKSI
jgi:hypothetical protein